jgi:hypothetical protein
MLPEGDTLHASFAQLLERGAGIALAGDFILMMLSGRGRGGHGE